MPPPAAPRRLPNGHLLVPVAVYPDGALGDGVTELAPGDPDYDRWDQRLAAAEALEPELAAKAAELERRLRNR